MRIGAPKIDRRSAADIAKETRAFLAKYLVGPPYNWRPDADGGETGHALTQIFSHYCGLIVDRLNQAPEKNFFAFLDLLGNSLIPGQPARTAVTFVLDTSAAHGSMLPAGTRIQAEPPPGVNEPIFFETENDLWLTTVDLLSIKREGTDLTRLINNPNTIGEPVFKEPEPYYMFCLGLGPDRHPPAQMPVDMYCWLDSAGYDPDTWRGTREAVALSWECSKDGIDWTRLLVEDETIALTRSGVVRFLTPTADGWETVTVDKKQRNRFWVRVTPPTTPDRKELTPEAKKFYTPPPQLRCVALNTVSAIQTLTVLNEILGSSNSNPGQVFSTLKKPVQPGQELAVLERRSSTSGTGDTGASRSSDDWTVWKEVDDFHQSEAGDRHYVLNHQTGQVGFGNGQYGMIPPLGARNVRMTRYRAGGGTAGNVSAGALKTLVAGSKQIARVTNLFAASAGANAEEPAALLDRAPRSLRHRKRAVTQEDYEDLAKLASTEVARALCVPLQDLADDPYLFIDTIDEEKAGVGKASVIIVPRTEVAKPLPSPDLLRRVQAYLVDRASTGAAVTVVGPLYLRVDTKVTIQLQSLLWKDVVERELQATFAAFLHPLTGNNGAGWPFGREPHESDLYPLVTKVKRIDYVASLDITVGKDDPMKDRIMKTERFLIYSGNHSVSFL